MLMFYVTNHVITGNNVMLNILRQVTRKEIMHFILIDGTWSNSAAMFRRLKVSAELSVLYFI